MYVCMYVCMYRHMYLHMYIHMYMYIYIYRNEYINIHIFIFMNIYIYMYEYVHMLICMAFDGLLEALFWPRPPLTTPVGLLFFQRCLVTCHVLYAPFLVFVLSHVIFCIFIWVGRVGGAKNILSPLLLAGALNFVKLLRHRLLMLRLSSFVL